MEEKTLENRKMWLIRAAIVSNTCWTLEWCERCSFSETRNESLIVIRRYESLSCVHRKSKCPTFLFGNRKCHIFRFLWRTLREMAQFTKLVCFCTYIMKKGFATFLLSFHHNLSRTLSIRVSLSLAHPPLYPWIHARNVNISHSLHRTYSKRVQLSSRELLLNITSFSSKE